MAPPAAILESEKTLGTRLALFAMGSKKGREKNPHFCIIVTGKYQRRQVLQNFKILFCARLVPSRHFYLFSQRNMKGNFTRTKALEEEGGKALRFSSFLPLMHRELIKFFLLITANTEKRLGTSLLLRVVKEHFKAHMLRVLPGHLFLIFFFLLSTPDKRTWNLVSSLLVYFVYTGF